MQARIAAKQDSGIIIMTDQTRRELRARDSIILHFGKFQKRLSIVLDNSLTPGGILIPAKISRHYTIPNLPYELRHKGNALHLGPVIGLMYSKRIYDEPDQAITRFARYDKIKGLIIIFTKRKIDFKRQLITGKYYDPATNSFIEAVVPFPSVIYLRSNPTPQLYRRLSSVLEAGTIYNYPFRSDKWEFWSLVGLKTEVKQHLPETRKFGPEEVLAMLKKYQSVYLKPIDWSRGRGIYRLNQEGGHYVLADTYGKFWTARSPLALIRLIKDLEQDREYLVQQDIRFSCQGQKVDFRIYLLKDSERRWQYLWLETKVANTGSIISNRRNQDDLLSGEAGLRHYYGLEQGEIRKIIAEMTNICIKALEAMERNGHSMGDVAFDLILDKNLKVWLLEAQRNYYSEKPCSAHMLEIIHPASLDYAKALTGF